MSIIDELALGIEASQQPEFKRFVRTGEASEAFLDYLDHDANAQVAVEKAFDAQSAALTRLAKAVKEDSLGSSSVVTTNPASQMVNAVGQVAGVPEAQRSAMLADFATNVTDQGAVAARRVQSTLAELQEALKSVVS